MIYCKHWTMRYLKNRIFLMIEEYRNPNNPWWTRDSVSIIESLLIKADSILEFGSGRSTVWLGNRCTKIISIEHDIKWAEKIKKLNSISCIDLKLVVPIIKSDTSKEYDFESYIYLDYPLNANIKFDVIVIDGLFRGHCAKLATEIIAPNGLIIIDNINWYLPSHSVSPSSIPFDGKPINDQWEFFYQKTKSWRRILTSNGVTDTAIYFS